MPVIKGTNGSDVIDAQDGVGNGGDVIYGYDGNDLIFGLGGNDIIIGGIGADAIYGGSGIDSADYAGSAVSVIVNLASGYGVGGTAHGDTLFSIEDIFGSSYNDQLIGNDSANTLSGSLGHDTLIGAGGDDFLGGGSGDDTLKGGGGADSLHGDFGIDTLVGGAGDDIYYAESEDYVSETAGEGYDVVFTRSYGYTLADNFETLSLASVFGTSVYGTGNAQANTIFGNSHDNILEGGGGADVMNGLGGNDNFVFRPGDANGDVVHEFNGNGVGVGEFMYFIGYGTIAQGATFHQLTATTWEIASADGLTHDVITLVGAPTVDAGDFVFV